MIAPDLETGVARLRELVEQAAVVVPFTGAGISTECGIPDFRSPGGIWTKMKPIDFGDFLASREMRDESWRRRFAMHEQFGGANGELAAAMQYSIQGLNCDDPERKDLLMDIGTEELSHLEVVGNGHFWAGGNPYANPVSALRRILVDTEIYRRLSLEYLKTHRPDLTIVYFEGTDSIGHVFAPFAPPKQPRIAQADISQGQVILRPEPAGRPLAAVALDFAPLGEGCVERWAVAHVDQYGPVRLLDVAILGVGCGELGEHFRRGLGIAARGHGLSGQPFEFSAAGVV